MRMARGNAISGEGNRGLIGAAGCVDAGENGVRKEGGVGGAWPRYCNQIAHQSGSCYASLPFTVSPRRSLTLRGPGGHPAALAAPDLSLSLSFSIALCTWTLS